ncbi:MAG: lipopolysaccharide biosynthesis protein [Acidimicrobiia bacterium]
MTGSRIADPTSRAAKLRRVATDGTMYIVGGTVVASFSAYLFQVVGGRVLGPADFAPVTALLTVHFIVFTVLLMPVEQFTIRSITLGRDLLVTGGGREIGVIVIGSALLAAVFTFLARDEYFGDAASYTAIIVAVVLADAALALGRGYLAGYRRFRDYGLVSGLAALVRLGLAVAFIQIAVSGEAFGWALALAPLIVLAWRPFGRPNRPLPESSTVPESARRFLSGFVLANAAAQILLLAAPLAVLPLGGSEALMSIVFVTFQLFRAPIVMVQNLLARFLPPFTSFAAHGLHHELRKWALRFGAVAILTAAPAAAAGALLGPEIVSALFGREFLPSATLSGIAAVGMLLASASLFAGQVLVARGQTPALAVAWVVGFVVAVVTLLLCPGDPDVRVAVGFLAGEFAALAAIVLAGTRLPSSAQSS